MAQSPAPIRYDPSVETRGEKEAETVEGLKSALHDIMETTSEDYGHAVRGVHAKSHGILEGTLEVMSGLAPEYAQGLFAAPGRYPVTLRISTNPGDLIDDSISLPRGLAMKVIGVEGERLPGSEGDATQDFIMVNGPVFAAPDAESFLSNLKLLAKTTDRAEWAKRGISAVFRGVEKLVEAVGGESTTLKTMGGAPNVHPLGETYYSQTPYRFGDYVAKFSLAPVSDHLSQIEGTIVDTSEGDNPIRRAVDRTAREGEAEYEFRVQLCRDLDTMPVEDPTVEWSEEASPYVTVARLRLPAQAAWSDEKAEKVDEAMRFSPWTGLAAHRPLGSVNRARRQAYEMSADFRSKVNGCPIHEPKRGAA
ncbi:MAG: catalase family protein [Pseudomonadota bacterium]|nr:catalase family protein [Pseudomonadota bacterium]